MNSTSEFACTVSHMEFWLMAQITPIQAPFPEGIPKSVGPIDTWAFFARVAIESIDQLGR